MDSKKVYSIIAAVGAILVVVTIAFFGKITDGVINAYYQISQDRISRLPSCVGLGGARELGQKAVDQKDPSVCSRLPDLVECNYKDGKGSDGMPWLRSYEELKASCLEVYVGTYPILELCQELEEASYERDGFNRCYLRVAVDTKDIIICDFLRGQYHASTCRALVSQDPKYCLDLKSTIYDRQGQDNSYYHSEPSYLQTSKNSCLSTLADLTKNKVLCDLMVPIDGDDYLLAEFQKNCNLLVADESPASDWYDL